MKKKKKRWWVDLLLVLILLIGLGIVAYPTFSDYWNSFHQSRAIISYAESVATLNTEEYEKVWDQALQYNQWMSTKSNQWQVEPEETEFYNTLLNVGGTGNMGYVSIPRINVNLPVYHGTEESVLQTSVGHIEGTSLPVGSVHDENDFSKVSFASHCVISGHRGLPSAKLFSDLDRMEIGDVFTFSILDQTLTHEVDAINVVEPNDSQLIEIVPEKDLVTLVTCTPYGINTHRLLVRGHRIENEKEALNARITADAIRIDAIYAAPFIAAPVLVLMGMWVMMISTNKKHRW
jgi:sortase A